MTTILNYCLNKFIPYAVISFLVFWQMDYSTIYPYIVVGFIFFIDKFSFKTGYSVAYCEANNIDLDNPPE